MDDKGSKNVGTYFGLALMIAGSTFLGYAVGYGLDKLFGTLKWPPLSRPFFGLNKLMSGGVVAS